MNIIYDRIIIIGSGTVAYNCALAIKKTGADVALIESRSDSVLSMKKFCTKNDISHIAVEPSGITDYLMLLTEKVLLLSISNRYIFPASVINKKNLTIINYHGALLPKYPGRNAEAWAIYSRDSFGGITWHRVEKDVDAGEILIQKKVEITPETTSVSLLKQYAKIATETFETILPALLDGSIVGYPQTGERDLMRYSWMKPNDGIFDLNFNEDEMCAFLRAMDYGALQTMGIPKLYYTNKVYDIRKYVIDKKGNDIIAQKFDNDTKTMIIIGEKYKIELYLI